MVAYWILTLVLVSFSAEEAEYQLVQLPRNTAAFDALAVVSQIGLDPESIQLRHDSIRCVTNRGERRLPCWRVARDSATQRL